MTSSPQAESPGARPAKPFDWKNLRQRAISAAILIPVTLGAVWAGGWLYLVLLAVAIALLSVEWGAMSSERAPHRAAFALLVAVLVPMFAAYLGWLKTAWLLVPATGMLAALFAWVRRLEERPADASFGVAYIAPPALALIWLRSGEDGRGWTLLLLLVCWAADSAAFITGSVLKGPKLWPRFSPNKTWSGFIGGLIGAAVTAVTLTALTPTGVPGLTAAAVIGLLVGLATMAGDLWESMLKRRFGVKDSGDLIPGHGGLLDRVDGLMFAALAMGAARLLLQGHA